jgi:hypothetical protein
MPTKNNLERPPIPGAIVEREGPSRDANRSCSPGSPNPGIFRSTTTNASRSANSEEAFLGKDNGSHDSAESPGFGEPGLQDRETESNEIAPGGIDKSALGANFEKLAEAKPHVVAALRDLMLQFRNEGIVARRHEIRRIKQARLFWQGLQYAWWNPNDMSWHLPFDQQGGGDKALEEMPRYQFVTNLYQAFGLSFVALISQDTPTTRFYPQSAQSEMDVAAARAASDVAELVEENNKVQQLLTGVGYYLWTDGKIGGYVRYVSDAQRFGWHSEDIVEEAQVKLGEDAYVCPKCGEESAVGAGMCSAGSPNPGIFRTTTTNASRSPNSSAYTRNADNKLPDSAGTPGFGEPGLQNPPPNFLSGTICAQCGAQLTAADFRAAEIVTVPRVVGTRRVPNGQEVITILGGLELNTPVWANEMHEFPYLQWQQEVHSAKLRAAYPHAAEKIQQGGPIEAEDVYARASRVAVAQGVGSTNPGDALQNLITFTRTWIRPWAFYAIEDKEVRAELLALFPEGAYVAFAGETYCEARNETLDDHWRVMHALPGDGQNRPSVGDSLIQIQERYNTLSNIQAETYEFGIPPIYADPQVLDFDALASQTAEPAAHYPARARPGQPLAASFFQPAAAQVPPEMLQHQQDLAGPISQFLTGLFPAVFGGAQQGNKTAAGYAMARDQALGRLGIVWRRLKQFYADLMLLSVDTFRKNRPTDVEIALLGPAGEFESKWIRLADLKGNIQAHAETDESFPRQKSQQRAVLQQLLATNDPLIAQALGDPENIGFIKGVFGLSELVVPGEDSREKQLREISQLLAMAPFVPVDDLLDDHAAELAECRRWASSDAGQLARTQNPAGFANVRAHAAMHQVAIAQKGAPRAAAPAAQKPIPIPNNES